MEKAPLPPKSEYCGSSFHRFRTFWNGSANCVPTKMHFYLEHFLFRFCALAVATHLVERDNLTTFYSVRIRIHGLRKNVYQVLQVKFFYRNSGCCSKRYVC